MAGGSMKKSQQALQMFFERYNGNEREKWELIAQIANQIGWCIQSVFATVCCGYENASEVSFREKTYKELKYQRKKVPSCL